MRLKSLSISKKAWFDYPDDADKAKFEIGLLTPGEEREVQAATSKIRLGESGNTMEMDHTRANMAKAMRALKNWENVFEDADANKPMVCNDKNKAKMLNEIPGFEAWVIEKYGELDTAVEVVKEKEKKNS